jgi:hypothetical protein
MFLLRLCLRLRNWLVPRNLGNSGLQQDRQVPYELGVKDCVARYIYSRSQIRTSTARPKPAAFDPSPHNELSVVHTTGLSSSEIWRIGCLTLGTQPGRTTIYGKVDIPVMALVEQKLHAVRDDDPFERHTSVLGWPALADPNEMKQIRKAICLELSQNPDIEVDIPPSPLSRERLDAVE